MILAPIEWFPRWRWSSRTGRVSGRKFSSFLFFKSPKNLRICEFYCRFFLREENFSYHVIFDCVRVDGCCRGSTETFDFKAWKSRKLQFDITPLVAFPKQYQFSCVAVKKMLRPTVKLFASASKLLIPVTNPARQVADGVSLQHLR